jgi:phenylpropionate dioxygenase-like ring-hydroxylating dioxygenase large terminal subunit
MFSGFARVWTAALRSAALKSKPVSVVVAGERLAFFRDASGKAHAVVDQCPHRGVRLSLGRVKGDCLECPFHGWTFDGQGQVCAVPWNPDAKLANLKTTAVPVEERAGVLWIYTAPLSSLSSPSPSPPPPLQLPASLMRKGIGLTLLDVTWKTHWTRAMENMLDWPHLPFVHKGTIGRDMAKAMPSNPRLDVDITTTPLGWSSTIAIAGRPQPGSLEFCKPNLMVLHIVDTPERLFCMHVAVVPVDDATTRMIVINARSFLTSAVFNPLFAISNKKIVNEDRAVVESSAAGPVPPAGTELSVRTDKLTLQFRKYWFDELREAAPTKALPVLAAG